MKVKKNDTVLVLTGKDAGKTGKVLSSDPKNNKVKVDGVNVQKKSKKARSANETSAIVSQVGAIDASNVLVVCPACNKATRVSYKIVNGKKVRVCKKCGASLDNAPVATKKSTKKAGKSAEEVTEAPVAEVKETAKKPTTKKASTKSADAPVEKKTTAKKTATKTADGEKPVAKKTSAKKSTTTADKAE